MDNYHQKIPCLLYVHIVCRKLDTKRKTFFANNKVCRTITCQECLKPRCAYDTSKVGRIESTPTEDIEYSNPYTSCGSELFPPSSSHYMTPSLHVKLCNNTIEVQHYSTKLVFPQIYYFCCLPDEVVNDDSIKELCKQYTQSFDEFASCEDLVGKVLPLGSPLI